MVEEYLNKIRPHLKDIIKNLKKFDTWKIQSTIANNFISSIDEGHIMYSKSDNIKIMINREASSIGKWGIWAKTSKWKNQNSLIY